MVTKTSARSTADSLSAYLQSGRAETLTEVVRQRLRSVIMCEPVCSLVRTEDDIHEVRLALDRLEQLRRERAELDESGERHLAEAPLANATPPSKRV